MKGAVLTFFTFVTALWFVLHAYLAVRILRPARGWKRAALAWVLLLLTALPPAVMGLDRRGAEFPMKDALRWVGFASMGFSSLIAFFFVAEDLVRAAGRVAARLRRRAPGLPPIDAGRRRFLRNSLNFGVMGVAGGLTAVEAGSARAAPRVRSVTIPIRGLHSDLAGFTIAQISDLHVGPTIRRDYVETVVRETNALGADLVAVTGDLVDGQVAEFQDDVAPLAGLAAPHGVWFVTGNHEYYWDPAGWLERIRGFGWRVLLNEHRVLERGAGRILLAGVTDLRSSRYVPSHVSDPAAARSGAPATDVSILLAHQPRSVFAASAAGYDLQISGHTHGGQYFPVSLLVRMFEPYLRGLHRHENTWIFVQSGTGYWGPPNRFGIPKEIALLTLARAE